MTELIPIIPIAELTAQVPFTRPDTTVDAETEVILYEYSPLKGEVKNIILHYPNGCNSLVEIVCYINQLQVLPITGVIALNNATVIFPVNRKIDRSDKLRVLIANKDTVNEHTPSAIWELRGIP